MQFNQPWLLDCSVALMDSADHELFRQKRKVTVPPPLAVMPPIPTHWVKEDGAPQISGEIDLQVGSAQRDGATLSLLVIDSGGIGGQATLSSLIRNSLGFPRGISGRRLAEEAYEQAWVFGARFAFMQEVTSLRADGDRILVGLSDFPDVGARAVILATGAAYRRLEVEAASNIEVRLGT
jgi:hypothetical protein